jgi:SM-20-related protein
MSEKLYTKIIDALVEDGYIIINNALGYDLAQNLKQNAKTQDDYKRAGISASNSLHVDDNRRRDKISWLDEDGASVSEFLSFAKTLQNTINRELYLGIKYYESHFAIYDTNDFYEKHLDAFKNSKNRVVTTVYYLNDEWSEDNGGELIIYDEDNKEIAKVLPKADTLVVFLSDKFPHEVRPAKKTRYSIAGWFRVK